MCNTGTKLINIDRNGAAVKSSGSGLVGTGFAPRYQGARCSSVVIAFAHGEMGHQIDPSWGGPIELFFISASAPRLV